MENRMSSLLQDRVSGAIQSVTAKFRSLKTKWVLDQHMAFTIPTGPKTALPNEKEKYTSLRAGQ